ncbi:macro domain-containing protein [Micromonospora echinofusca]|uniref:macro domain-containing protein n=1 Tax=Micromonospora echinofusca TaxID=47858 RepID=UPI0027DC1086|nr:macro domain-containing protein [Micromonospora echinofusca]
MRIELVAGDITTERVDAVANAANSSPLGGGGVDGATHRKGGPAIREQCRALRPAGTGGACRSGRPWRPPPPDG